jgi:hypothetical protein
MNQEREALMVVAVTPNEVIALQHVLNLYAMHIEHRTQDYQIVEQLLQQFRARLVTNLPTVMPVARRERGPWSPK